jgi:hypothetical protein
MIMKNFLLSTLLAVAVCLCGIRPVFAADEASKTDEIEALLRQAETATDPGPLLQKAKDDFAKYKPQPYNGGGVKRRGVEAAATKRKEEAMRAIDEAIAVAKTAASAPKDNNALGSATAASGPDLKAKIEDAVTKVRLTAEMKK